MALPNTNDASLHAALTVEIFNQTFFHLRHTLDIYSKIGFLDFRDKIHQNTHPFENINCKISA